MNEFIEVRFQRNGRRLRVKRQVPGGIEFDESEPLERTVGIGFDARAAATKERLNSIRRVQGWEPGQFKLNISVEDGSLILRGVNEHALPAGFYKVRLEIEEAKTGGFQSADIEENGHAEVTVPVEMDDRIVKVNLAGCDADIRTVLDRSKVDGETGAEWLEDSSHRPTRQACLLNLLASLRARPTASEPLLALVSDVFMVANDRMFTKVDRTLLDRLNALALDPSKPFFAEGKPHAAIHGRLLSGIPDPGERPRFKDLLSFRGEGKPSMQVVVAVPPPDLPHTYAEFDLDLGNPLQDVLGFIVHMGELLSGKPTNHLDMRKRLAGTKAGGFLAYTVGTVAEPSVGVPASRGARSLSPRRPRSIGKRERMPNATRAKSAKKPRRN